MASVLRSGRFISETRRRAVVPALAAALFCGGVSAQAADWPTFRHDMHRSGATSERPAPAKFVPRWVWRSPFPPVPAWAGPARWDAYHNVRNLKSMRNYDVVFHPAIAGGSVWFASSADNTVYCLDGATGSIRWKYTVDAAVRTTPTWAAGRLYFGADDGCAYCLDAGSGRLLWKYRPSPAAPYIIHDGRPISPWPCRTTPVVDRGTVYFGMALLPWKQSYFCALDAATGKPEGTGRYVRRLDGATFEGPLAASKSFIVSPQGRVPPLLFHRATGAPAGRLKYKHGGGCFVLLAGAGKVFNGPGSKAGWITEHNVNSGDEMAVFPGGNALVVAGNTVYLLRDETLSALELKSRNTLWRTRCDCPYELIDAGGILFAGGMDKVLGLDSKTGAVLWRGRVRGRAYGLAVAGGALYVATDAGALYCFGPGAKQPPNYAGLLGSRPEENAAGPAAPPPDHPPKDKTLFGRWIFRTDQIANGKVRDAAGRHPGKLLGTPEIVRAGRREVLVLDGTAASVRVADDISGLGLPKKAITVTAWVRVDRPITWGGIAGAFQDNGTYEHGWVLGYNQDRFSFAVRAEHGNGRLTYLKAKTPFRPKHWYFVAGVYDGARLRVYVNGRLEAESGLQKGPIDYPPHAFLELGAYHDKDEYNRLKGRLHEVRIYARALSDAEIRKQYEEKAAGWPVPPPPAPKLPGLDIAVGPWARFLDRRSAVIRWFSREPQAFTLVLSTGKTERRIREPAPARFHELTVDHLRRNRIYQYTLEAPVDGALHAAGPYELDTLCNYTLPRPPASSAAETGPAAVGAARLAREILTVAKRSQGLCFILGLSDGRLPAALVRNSNFRIIGLDDDPARVAAARERLFRDRVYGVRATVLAVPSATALPFHGAVADLVLVRKPEFLAAASRMVAPYGVLLAGTLRNSHPGLPVPELLPPGRAVLPAGPGTAVSVRGRLADWQRRQRPPLPGSGAWTHEYGRADNSATDGESLQGAASTKQLLVQWLGRPGPRARPDRNGRMNAPLAVAGRLFSPGLNRMIAIDAYNGSILWSLDIPGFLRCNIPHDCGNWCADSGHLYAAVRDRCWRITAAGGIVDAFYPVRPGPNRKWKWEWSYIARPEHTRLLVGSAAKAGSSFKNFWGGFGWYDAKNGPQTAKVSSDNLFALDAETGRTLWTYTNHSVLLNCTITIGDNRVWFVACRDPQIVGGNTRRCLGPHLWQRQFLVCLDLESGKKLWERPLKTAPGTAVFYLAAGSGRLVLEASDKRYHLYGFDASDGRALWTRECAWAKDNHGGHMSRPAILGDRVYVRPYILDLNTGKLESRRMPMGACGTYAFSDYAGFYRYGGCLSVWDVNRPHPERWPRLRPDCWLSSIPACGMFLSPEGGGGCSCGAWMETSIGFLPAPAARK